MIATAHKSSPTSHAADASARFTAMLPRIRKHAARVFRELNADAREEAIQEVIANCYVAYARLVERGRADLAFATPLAQFAIKRFRHGRRVGCRRNSGDVTSPFGQRVRRSRVESLDVRDKGETESRAILIEDKTAGPADTAAARLDFAAWRRRLPVRLRRLALLLARGETSQEAARHFQVSSARISQLRSWLRQDWETFQGMPSAGAVRV